MSGTQVPIQKHLRIGPAWHGLTVFDAVRAAFPEVAPREVWRLSRSGALLRDGARCHPLDLVRRDQTVSVTVLSPRLPEHSSPTAVQMPVATEAGPFWIVREDAQLLAVSKPAGCASHPAARRKGDTLIERVRAYLGVKPEDRFQPALANRLDIDTSGVVLIAKTRSAQRRLGRHIQRGRLRKRYLALVGGWPEPPIGEVTTPLMRRPDSRDLARFGADHPRARGRLQAARTCFFTRERLHQVLRVALLEVEIFTGRTHQIRRHLAEEGYPVAGDRLYGDPELNRELAAVAGLQRMFLHAAAVDLEHPANGEPLCLEAPLPPELSAALTSLGHGSGKGECLGPFAARG